MSGPRSTAELLDIDPARSAADEASIAASWEKLTELLDVDVADGGITEGQYRYVLEREPSEDAGAWARNTWARMLRVWLRNPGSISANADALRTWPCRCGPGDGWVYEPSEYEAGGYTLTVTYAAPCPDCNPRQRLLWLDHWTQGGDHRCPECAPKGGRTPTPLNDRSGASGEARAQAEADERQAAEDAMLFGSSGGGLA